MAMATAPSSNASGESITFTCRDIKANAAGLQHMGRFGFMAVTPVSVDKHVLRALSTEPRVWEHNPCRGPSGNPNFFALLVAQSLLTNPRANDRATRWRWRTLIVIVTVSALFPLITSDFGGWDDELNVVNNAWLNPPSWRGVARYWSAPAFDLYVPLT